jgi:maleylacetoacetate isomerase
MIKLYSYFRSSTAYRVRIGLNLKRLDYEIVPVNLLKSEQKSADYAAINPMEAVPALDHDGFLMTQSLAILNYLENLVPEPPLASGTPQELAYVRQIALTVATDIHPVTNLRILNHLKDEYQIDEARRKEWYIHWTRRGMDGLEGLLRQRGWHGDFALKDRVSVADLCIVPQMYNLRRYGIDPAPYPICRAIEANCMKIKAFQDASPEMQPDAPDGLEPIHGPLFKAA